MVKECMLTTTDNPYSPFEQFKEWYMYDVEKGYNTCSQLARIARISDDMTQDEVDFENERAMNEIIKYDFMNIYKKVYNNTPDAEQTTP